jgi:hypothetical protein
MLRSVSEIRTRLSRAASGHSRSSDVRIRRREILRGRNHVRHRGNVDVQIAMVQLIQYARAHDLIQREALDHQAILIRRALDGYIQDVVVSMPERVVAFSV